MPAPRRVKKPPTMQLRSTPRLKEALERLKQVFVVRPGVKLTIGDASRIAGLDSAVCAMLLRTLAKARVVEKHRSGAYVGRSSGPQ